MIDTVELFYFKRHRKLGLRFLAAFLLGIDIQQLTHDSIEDARTALRLYECYKRLDAQGRVRRPAPPPPACWFYLIVMVYICGVFIFPTGR